jgi:hypothetical protein
MHRRETYRSKHGPDFAAGKYLLFNLGLWGLGGPLYVARNVEEAVAFYNLNEELMKVVREFVVTKDYPLDLRAIKAVGFELPIKLDRVYEHVVQDAWDAYDRQDDHWNIACQDALAILAKLK